MQSLMRHANSNITMKIYAHAVNSKKRRAQSNVVEMILPDNNNNERQRRRVSLNVYFSCVWRRFSKSGVFGMNGGDDGTRTRGLCRDRSDRNRNLLKLNGTDGTQKGLGALRKPYWTVIGHKKFLRTSPRKLTPARVRQRSRASERRTNWPILLRQRSSSRALGFGNASPVKTASFLSLCKEPLEGCRDVNECIGR